MCSSHSGFGQPIASYGSRSVHPLATLLRKWRFKGAMPADQALHPQRDAKMNFTTRDCTVIFFKDWGPRNAKRMMFHHGWPPSADD
jgi:hypothetical protein